MIASQRLYLVADKSELVAEGDERAASLYATEGHEIPAEVAERFGLVDGALPEKAAKKPKDPAETKPANAAETKA
jgi:hypothetical protein